VLFLRKRENIKKIPGKNKKLRPFKQIFNNEMPLPEKI